MHHLACATKIVERMMESMDRVCPDIVMLLVNDPRFPAAILRIMQHRYFENKPNLFPRVYYAEHSSLQGAKKLLERYLVQSPSNQFFNAIPHAVEIKQIIEAISTHQIVTDAQLLERLRKIRLLQPVGLLAEMIVFLENEVERDNPSHAEPGALASEELTWIFNNA